jgi:hypothetical protein
MVSVETVSIVVAAASIVVGVYLSLQSRKQELETRQADLFMQMYHRWSSPEYRMGTLKMMNQWSWENFDDFIQKYDTTTNLEEHVNGLVVPASFFEGIGVLVERGLIDITLVDRLMHNSIIAFWERLGPIIQEYRKSQKSGMHPHFDSVEDLYHRLQSKQLAS